jgi:uncharacterized protein
MKLVRTLQIAVLGLGFVVAGCTADVSSADQPITDDVQKGPTAPGEFAVFRGSDGQYYFHLAAGNGEIVLQSEGYGKKAAAVNGILSVKDNGIDIENYELRKGEDAEAQWYFVLLASNGQVIGVSETYDSESNAERGTEDVRDLVAKILQYEATVNDGAKFDLHKSDDGQWYFELETADGRVLLQSEAYVNRTGALNGIESVRANGRDPDQYTLETGGAGTWYYGLTAKNGQEIGESPLYPTLDAAAAALDETVALITSERVGNPY